MGNKIQTAQPVLLSLTDAVCPDCGHAEMGKRDWVTRLFRMRAACPYWETSAETGVGLPGECSCTHGYHS